MTKIATQEQISHTLDNIMEHHHGRPATAFWQAGRDLIHCKGKWSTCCSVWRCRLPSRTVFFPYFSSATEQTHGGRLIVVCVFSFLFHFCHQCCTFVLYGIMFFEYAHSVGCHRTHFPAHHSFFYICLSLPIHIWFLSVDRCI